MASGSFEALQDQFLRQKSASGARCARPVPESSLANLYDPLAMPPALLKAHQKLDAAVDKAYEFSGGKKSYETDAERVAQLFELYQRLTSLLPAESGKKPRKSSKTRIAAKLS